MAHQSPMISIPKKTTDDVDWTGPIRSIIQQSYGESPDNYATECQQLQRCRQDAVRGAGSDNTARDLLYKYFGQLELLELRFSEIRVTFPWHDAFTNKLTTQTSIAYEKASILFQIASTHSAIAASQNRCDPEGLKRAFYFFKACAGMLTYVNENFLHAPSTDLSREVVKFLVNVILAQATEVFFEKCTEEKKGAALVSKVGAQAASMYTSLCEEVKEFMGKGIFDRNWVTLLQIKAKYFSSLSQYYRGTADIASGAYGDALVRFTLAETHAKEASRSAATFNAVFNTNLSPNLPADAGSSISERTKAHLATCTERKNEASKDNDLIYNAIIPSADALPVIEKTVVAKPIPIQEVYNSPDVRKVIGPDIFARLIPLSVHESASVYSEEKAKLVRTEVEKADTAEVELKSALESIGVRDGLNRFKAMSENTIGVVEEIPVEVQRWRDDIGVMEERESVDSLLAQMHRLKDDVSKDLDGVRVDLDGESRLCEQMRVKYDLLWTQEPSGGPAKPLRQELKAHDTARSAASASDEQVAQLWSSVRNDVGLLLSPDLENVFAASAQKGPGVDSLLDLDTSADVNDDEERVKIGKEVDEIEERLSRLSKISHERGQVLKDLKDKIQTDDVSHLLLMNRGNTGVETTLFAAELEKFRPYQQRLAASVQYQQSALQEVQQLWKKLRDQSGRGQGAKKWEERERRKKDTVRRFSRTRDGYMEVRDGLAKGLQFYQELTELASSLKASVKVFLADRTSERNRLVGSAESQQRLTTSPPPRVPPPPSSNIGSLNSSFGSMNLGSPPPLPPPPAPPQQVWQQNYTPPPRQYTPVSPPPPPPQSQQPAYASPHQYSHPQYAAPPQPNYGNPVHRSSSLSYSSIPPPPTPTAISPPPSVPTSDPYASLGDAFGTARQASLPPPPPPPPSSQYSQYPSQYQYPQQQQQQSAFPPPPGVNYQYYQQQTSPQQSGYQPSAPPQQPNYGQYQSNQHGYNR